MSGRRALHASRAARQYSSPGAPGLGNSDAKRCSAPPAPPRGTCWRRRRICDQAGHSQRLSRQPASQVAGLQAGSGGAAWPGRRRGPLLVKPRDELEEVVPRLCPKLQQVAARLLHPATGGRARASGCRVGAGARPQRPPPSARTCWPRSAGRDTTRPWRQEATQQARQGAAAATAMAAAAAAPQRGGTHKHAAGLIAGAQAAVVVRQQPLALVDQHLQVAGPRGRPLLPVRALGAPGTRRSASPCC
jgi:hypothetical protein